MDRVELAVELHKKGYNCAQAVACAYAEAVGVDEAVLYKIAEGFGGGLGCGKGQCGALSGATIIAGLVHSDGDTAHPGQTKRETCGNSREMLKYFEEHAKAIICRDIKGGGTGVPLTSCSDCVRIGAEAVREVLGL